MNRVFILGAGFTRAFLPSSPLLVDDFYNTEVASKLRGLPHATSLLDSERNHHPRGFINIERLMTRLDSLMPYDHDRGIVDEYRLLLTELKRNLLRRVTSARDGEFHQDDLMRFARHCYDNDITCITFNYDDVLDEALYRCSVDGTQARPANGWDPDTGYGFHCRPYFHTVGDFYGAGTQSSIQLLKLHGSVNWRPRRGYETPYAVDAITHYESWGRRPDREDLLASAERHIEREPLIVPPVLLKSSLANQSVLHMVWSLAYDVLGEASGVTFLGYSLPSTDIAAWTLFREALHDMRGSDVRVVNFAERTEDRRPVQERYGELFPAIPDENFNFDGVRAWLQTL